MVNWHIKMDYLRCSPMFSGRPRYDFVIADRPGGLVFVRLVLVFVCRVGERDFHLALVQLLEKKSRAPTKIIDKNLSIIRWHIRPRNRCEVIPLNCIVCGAGLVADKGYSGDYFVIDMLDEDMFLRVNKMS